MTDTEREVFDALQELEGMVRRMKTSSPPPDLMPVFARLDALTNQMRGGDPSLLHYLHKKSYEKARIYLEGRDAENARGACDR